MQTICKSEIEHLAKERFGYPAGVFEFKTKIDGGFDNWFGLRLTMSTGASKIIGCRRSLDELVGLIRRGPAMECLDDAKPSRPDSPADQSRVREDSTQLDPRATS